MNEIGNAIWSSQQARRTAPARGRGAARCAALGRLAATAADGGDQQMFGAKEQAPHGGQCDQEAHGRHNRDLARPKHEQGKQQAMLDLLPPIH
jgi:hypothetical protein